MTARRRAAGDGVGWGRSAPILDTAIPFEERCALAFIYRLAEEYREAGDIPNSIRLRKFFDTRHAEARRACA